MPKMRTLLSDDPWANEIKIDDSITKKVITFINQPTYLTILLTVLFYIIVSSYYVNYFNRLSIPFNALNLPFTFYLESGYNLLLVIIFFILIVIISLISLSMLAESKKEAVYSLKRIQYYRNLFKLHTKRSIRKLLIFASFSEFTNLVSPIIIGIGALAFLMAFFIIFSAWAYFFLPQQSFKEWIFLTISIATLIIYPITIKFFTKHDTGHYIFGIKLYISKFLILLYLFIIIFSIHDIPSIMGINAAEDLIRGEGSYSEVQLYLKDQNISLSNKTLIFITQCNGNYYLVEKSNPVPKTAKMYIVSEKEVKMLLIERCYNYSNKYLLTKNISWQHFW